MPTDQMLSMFTGAVVKIPEMNTIISQKLFIGVRAVSQESLPSKNYNIDGGSDQL